MKKSISELRQDLVSGDWILIATGRAKRPHDFLKEKRVFLHQAKKMCPFEALHRDTLAVYSQDGDIKKVSPRLIRLGRPAGGWSVLGGKNWWVEVIPNKFPALGTSRVCPVIHGVGPYRTINGVGFHEIVITRDHYRSIAAMSDREVAGLIHAYQDRYAAFQSEECV